MLRPLFARVLLEREKAEKVGSLFLPQNLAKMHATLKCKVIATGPTADPSIRPGQNVIIGLHTGTWINADGRPVADPSTAEFFIVQDEDILCVVESETNERRDPARDIDFRGFNISRNPNPRTSAA